MAKTTKPAAQVAAKKTEDSIRPIFAFGKENYILMAAGVLLIILGFVLMMGGSSTDPNVFNEEMYSFRRITLAPILILIGFGVEIVAIMKKTKE